MFASLFNPQFVDPSRIRAVLQVDKTARNDSISKPTKLVGGWISSRYIDCQGFDGNPLLHLMCSWFFAPSTTYNAPPPRLLLLQKLSGKCSLIGSFPH